ncbi:MAG: helix-turn-helix domain-containing protein [Nanopusillaceae archaeon]
MKRLHHFLREIREEKGHSQEEVAKKLNISLRTIYRYEKGEIIPKLKFLQRFAEVMTSSEEERKELYSKLIDLRNEEIKLLRKKLNYVGIPSYVPTKDVIISGEGESLILLSERILSDMRKKGISSEILAKKTGIDILKLRGIIIGEEIPTYEELERIAMALEVPLWRYLVPFLENLEKNEQLFFFFARDKGVKNLITALASLSESEKQKIISMFSNFLTLYLKKKE